MNRSSPSPDVVHAWMVEVLPRAVAYAAGLLLDGAAAEDVVQDCCCRLLRKADGYDLPREGRKLLFKAITNACFTLNSRRKPMLRLDGESAITPVGEQQLADPTALSPERLAMHRELVQAVAEGLTHLPPAQRAALELNSLGHSQQEIAEVLETTPGNVRVLVFRARQTMAECLAPFLGEAAG